MPTSCYRKISSWPTSGIAAVVRSLHVPLVSRHSIRQAKRDDLAYPVRVRIRVPENGLGKLLDGMIDWLRENVPAADYACHSAPGLACSTAAFYFREVGIAHAFVSAFPAAELADGVGNASYAFASAKQGG